MKSLLQSFSIACFVMLGTFCLNAQTVKAFENAGKKAEKDKDWASAMHYYDQALARKPESPSLISRYAQVCLNYYAFEEAEINFSKLVDKPEWLKAYPESAFFLGQVLKARGKYSEASAQFQSFLINEEGKDSLLILAKRELENCRWAIESLADSLPAEVIHLDKNVNSSYSDFAPLGIGDSLFYSSYRYLFRNDDYYPQRRLTKVMLSKGNSRARPEAGRMNELDRHNANLTISPSGNRFYLSRCDFTGVVSIMCSIYYKDKNDSRTSRRPRKLPEPINLEGYTNTQASACWDSLHNAEGLFFVSDRPGGKGGLDIWYSWQNADGEWAEPQNCTFVNTPYDDVSPFYDPHHKRLFFSSKGWKNRGGFDVFYVHRQKEGWSDEIIPMPYPINSSYNDVYFSINKDSSNTYLASNRPGSFFLDEDNKTCCNDIYKVVFPEPEPDPEEDLIVQEEEEEEIEEILAQEEAEEVEEEKSYNILEDFLPLKLYFDNDYPDPRSRKTTTEMAYQATFEEYYQRQEEYVEKFGAGIRDENKRLSETDFLKSFFEYKVKKGNDLLTTFSELLLKRLNEGEEIEIFLKGFTSPRAKSDYNLNLGKRRVSCVRNHFLTYKNGIFKPFLKSRQLVISERSFGETEARKSVSDDLSDLRNSVYSVEASQERRVEIVEIVRD